MKYIQDMENQSNLRAILLQDLKELGIKPPKPKKHKSRDDGGSMDNMVQGVFGNSLCNVPSVAVQDCGPVPRFLVEATRLLEPHLETEGLFRKSGSVTRQKELKDRIELGEEVKEAHPLDMCSLIKQFFRELPDPLLTTRLHDTFIKCFTLDNENLQVPAILLLCLLLPWQHLSTLRFFMKFLSRVAACAEQNKMDVANLAVCLAPNVLHCNNKSEKMNITESKMLQAQTNIVEILIVNAEDIGMVCPSLCDRTNMMYSSCFPSEDELERSAETTQEEGKAGKKKKRRSGSLQGLVNNLSNSFQKWRRDSKGNTSSVSDKSSMISYMSDTIDASSCEGIDLDPEDNSPDYPTSFPPDFTPKVMRKRKASSEMIPFSASKKKAILQQMPQMSTLGGTPFTPHVKSKGRHQDMSVGTPCIKFADGQQMVFNAETPMQTPRRKIERFLSPTSGTKVKRQPSGKSSCFNQKTPKTKRRSVKGFFRRLSGGKDPQPASGITDSSDAASRLANISGPPDRLIVMEPGSLRKKSGLFRRHRKTPSSPARLLHDRNVSSSAESSFSSQDEALLINQESITNLALAAKLKSDLVADPEATPISRPHKRGYSGDGSFGNGGLRRGRPNTIATGLPIEKYKPSPNRSRRSMDAQVEACLAGGGPTPLRQSSQKEIFVSPERHERLECDPGAFDTSPIPLAEPLVHDIDGDLDDEDDDVVNDDGSEGCDADSEESIISSDMSRENSVTSLASEESVVPENHMVTESEHDQAFINESMLASDSNEEGICKLSNTQDTTQGTFKAPTGLPVSKRREEAPFDSEKLNASVASDVSDTSVCTVIYNGQPISSKYPLPLRREPAVGAPCSNREAQAVNESKLKPVQHQRMNSIVSTDSAVDCSGPHAEGSLSKCNSVNSVQSVDSGMGSDICRKPSPKSKIHSPEAALETRPDCDGEARGTCPGAPGARPMSRSVPLLLPKDKPAVSRHSSFHTLKEGNNPMMLQKRADASDSMRRVGAEPKLQISSDMHHMLARAGVVSGNSKKSRAPFVAVPVKTDSTATEQDLAGSCLQSRESILDIQDSKSGSVAESVKQFDSCKKEVLDRHTSPLRFTNSVQRRQGVSPVRIPTIFAKADQEASKYREMALSSLKMSPKPVKARANLPISTNLVRNKTVENARHRLSGAADESNGNKTQNLTTDKVSGPQCINMPQTPKCSRDMDLQVGHTPPIQLQNPVFQSIDINESLLETINDVCTPKSEKCERKAPLGRSPPREKSSACVDSDQTVRPKIKPNLISGSIARRITVKTGLGMQGQKTAIGGRSRCRSPVKPVKRLQGQPRSPRSPLSPRNIANKSPRRFRTTPPVGKGKSAISPIPPHVTDWDM